MEKGAKLDIIANLHRISLLKKRMLDSIIRDL